MQISILSPWPRDETSTSAVEMKENKTLLFISVGLHGHILPLLSLARELRARGYAILFATHEEGRPIVENLAPDLDFVSLGLLPVPREKLYLGLSSWQGEANLSMGLMTDIYSALLEGMHGVLWNLFVKGEIDLVPSSAGEMQPSHSLDVHSEEECSCDVSQEHPPTDKFSATNSADCKTRGADRDGATPPFCRQPPPDLIVVDAVTLPGLDLADKLGVKRVVNSPTVLPDFSSFQGTLGTPLWAEPGSLIQRCIDAVAPRLTALALAPALSELYQKRLELGLRPHGSPSSMFQGGRLIVNVHPHMMRGNLDADINPIKSYTGPLLNPNIFRQLRSHWLSSDSSAQVPWSVPSMIASWLEGREGSIIHERDDRLAKSSIFKRGRWAMSSKGSTRKCVEIDDGNVDGAVFVSFGHLPRITPDQAMLVVEGLSAAAGGRLNTLWLVPLEDVKESLGTRTPLVPDGVQLPGNVRMKAATAELDYMHVMSHPSMRLAVSHCGATAAQEAISLGLPLLCVPFLGDQPQIAEFLKKAGAALVLSWQNITAVSIASAVERILSEPSFASSAERLAGSLLSLGGVVRAADVVESELAVGSSHIMPPELSLPWHQQWCLDIVLFFLATGILGSLLSYAFWRLATVSFAEGQPQHSATLEQCSVFPEDDAIELNRPAKEREAKEFGVSPALLPPGSTSTTIEK